MLDRDPVPSGVNVRSLNGDGWKVCALPAGPFDSSLDLGDLVRDAEWLPARVPGNVRADLCRLGRVPDPHHDPSGSAWVDDHPWCYRTRCSLDRDARTHLVLEGVDTQSWVYVGDRLLSPSSGHEGMFGRQVYELSGQGREVVTLSVVVQGSAHLGSTERRTPWERFLDRIERGPADQHTQRFQTVKCQMGFGWDFAPAVRTMGIWDDATLVSSGPVYCEDLHVRTSLDGERAVVQVELTLDSIHSDRVHVAWSLEGKTFTARPLRSDLWQELTPGRQQVSWEIAVPDPRLWWPWDQGSPDLYELQVWISGGDGRFSDWVRQPLGVRTIALKAGPGTRPGQTPWVVHVNGRPVTVRGANWVPADILPGGVRREDYAALLEMARAANMNALRVWGGGLREKRAFYDLCDRMGILVWQEFPFACAFLTRYSRHSSFLAVAEDECRSIVRALRNHPSLVLWCGGNEFSPRRHRDLVSRVKRAADELDGTRPFRPASPYEGDGHNWDVWHGLAPSADYRRDRSRFASEFGLQSPPSVAALRATLPDADLWPPGPAWAERCAQWAGLVRYAAPALGRRLTRSRLGELTLDEFVAASQRAQALGLQTAIEHYRRRKYACAGSLLWQLNEPWPAITWSLIDHARDPKPAYDAVRRAYNPLLVSLEYQPARYREGDLFQAGVWVINDWPEDRVGCCVEVRLWDAEGQAQDSWLHTMRVDADSARRVGSVQWTLPEGGDWRVTARLFQGDAVLAENEYELSFYDPKKMSLYHWLCRRLAGLLVAT